MPSPSVLPAWLLPPLDSLVSGKHPQPAEALSLAINLSGCPIPASATMAAAFLRAAKKPPTTSCVARASSDRKRCYVTSPCSGFSEIKDSFDSQISIHSNRTLKPSVRDSSSREMASTICERLQVPRLSLARFDRAVARSMFRWKTCSSIKKVRKIGQNTICSGNV
jgi:hypothetical protein